MGVSPGTYLYSLAQNERTFATIGSDKSVLLFDGSLQKNFSAHHDGVSCLASQSNGFATAGRDGMIRCWDGRAKTATTILSEVQGREISSIACREHIIAAGTESSKEGLGDVSVLLYDTRNPSTPLYNYCESHTDSITQLAFHPAQPNVLLSASTDGLVSLFDVNQADEEDALQQVLNPRAAVHCAGFLSATEVYVVTTDEQYSVYDLSEDTSGSALDYGDVREKLQCTYVVDIVNTAQPPALVFGDHVSQKLSVAPLDQSNAWSFGPTIDLPGAHGEEIVRDMLLLHAEGRAISCGEDGQVKVWDLSGV